MRSTLRTAFFLLYNIAVVGVIFSAVELGVRKLVYGDFGSPVRRTELILDRWAAFRNQAHYRASRAEVNSEGFRRASDLSLTKPAATVRVFLLGGSVAYGGETLYPEIDPHWQFLDNNQTIDHYLEARLNSAFPERHWEVVNAAVKGYFLNQDLALYLSTLQRYKPDYLILLDGVNDVFGALRSPEGEDGYSGAGFADDFEGLTNPEAMSVRLMSTTWLFNHSALYRSIRESVAGKRRIRARQERAKSSIANFHPTIANLSPAERQHVQTAAGWIENYAHTVRQIHVLAGLDGAEALFFLQPQIAVSRKPFTSVESRLFDYWSRLDGPLNVYGFQTMYPRLANRLTIDAAREGFHFVDLTNVFDQAKVQMYTDYCHLTPEGNAAIANAMFESMSTALHSAGRDKTP